jgi:hypothetical protein
LRGIRIRTYTGFTWVAFLDLCGFKAKMKKGLAQPALDKFYNTIFKVNVSFDYYNANPAAKQDIDDIYPGASLCRLVVSDCAIIYIDDMDVDQKDEAKGLQLILRSISRINRRLIDTSHGPQLMTTCGVSYGYFKYVSRLEDEHIEKRFFYGDTYLRALEANEEVLGNGNHGYCLVTKANVDTIELERRPFQLKESNDRYYSFHWMVENPKRIQVFEQRYRALSKQAYRQKAKLLYNEAKITTNRVIWQN